MTRTEYIRMHEGLVLRPYKDSVGKFTIGIGRNIEDNGITEDEAYYMLENDIQTAVNELETIFDDFNNLPNNVQLVMIDMMFNIGKPRFSRFKLMIQAVKDGDYKEAARQARDSKWCIQVGSRCDHNYDLLYNA